MISIKIAILYLLSLLALAMSVSASLSTTSIPLLASTTAPNVQQPTSITPTENIDLRNGQTEDRTTEVVQSSTPIETMNVTAPPEITATLTSTFGGNAGGAPCYFPFQYEDVIYHTCTVVNNNGVLWCSTTSNYDEDNEWGNCKSTSECDSKPCLNGGQCIDEVNRYSCVCRPGYEGAVCQTNTNECLRIPCQNDGTCEDSVNGYNCSCAAGFQGINCEINTDECQSDPCQSGATCQDEVNGYTCKCLSGFYGTNCETNINECLSNPCQNDAKCRDKVNGYDCSCLSGFNGSRCEININECLSNPCQNDAKCRDKVNGYDCSCLSGFNGTRCEIGLLWRSCEGSSREGLEKIPHGERSFEMNLKVSSIEWYICNHYRREKQGLTAFQTDIDECKNDPCQHGATCQDKVNGYTCKCLPGFYGPRCEIVTISINECVNDPCRNNATCKDEINGYSCKCLSGFTGLNCEKNINECEDNPCENGGTCEERVNGYICNCPPGFFGLRCEASVFIPCIPVPGNPTCIPSYCCYGNLATWTGVRTNVNISYTETICKNGIPTVVTKKKSCGTLCSSKHCSSRRWPRIDCGGAVSTVVQLTALLMALGAYWILVEG